MSSSAIAWAWGVRVKNPAHKLTLVAYAEFVGEQGTCYVSQPTVAEMTGSSIRTVSRHLRALEKLGVIRREKRTLANGGRTSDLCIFLAPAEALRLGQQYKPRAKLAWGDGAAKLAGGGRTQLGGTPPDRGSSIPLPGFGRGTVSEPLKRFSKKGDSRCSAVRDGQRCPNVWTTRLGAGPPLCSSCADRVRT